VITAEFMAFLSAFADLRKAHTADEVLPLLITLSSSMISSSENPDEMLERQIAAMRKDVPRMVAELPRALAEIAKARKVRKSQRRANKGLNKWQ